MASSHHSKGSSKMAILKNVLTPQGVNATYHKLVKAEIDANEQVLRAQIAIFASPEARNEGKLILWNEYVTIPFSEIDGNPLDLFYPILSESDLSYLKDGEPDESVEIRNGAIRKKQEAN